MADVSIRGVDLLQDRMQKTQESLKDVDENIKKLTGRSPGDFRGGRRGRGGFVLRGGRDPISSRLGGERGGFGRSGSRLFNIARRSIIGEDDGPPMKRRSFGGGPRYRDSDDEDFGRPTGLSSSVMQSVQEIPSREASMNKQKEDRKGQARNRRMFGLLLGTLQKFKDDTSTQNDKNKKRQEIEEKLERRAKDEKLEVIRQRQTLFNERKRKTAELHRLETKLSLVENHQIWEQETVKLKNFIRTEAKPHLFWMPKDHIPETLRKQHSSKKVIDDQIEERKIEMEKDIEALLLEAENEKKQDEEMKMEHRRRSDSDGDGHRAAKRSPDDQSDSDDEMRPEDPANQVTLDEVPGDSDEEIDAEQTKPVAVLEEPTTDIKKEEAHVEHPPTEEELKNEPMEEEEEGNFIKSEKNDSQSKVNGDEGPDEVED